MEFVNDADYKVSLYETIDGKCNQIWMCPIYKKWAQMKTRTTNQKYQNTRPTYSGSFVHDDWKLFSNFKIWVDNHPVGIHISELELDKDLINSSMQIYSPQTCLLIPSYINNAFKVSSGSRGEYPLGVSLKNNNFKSCSRMFGTLKHLGTFRTTQEAHKAWQLGKIEYTELIIQKYKTEKYYYQDVEYALINIKSRLVYDYANNIETIKI